MKFLIYFIVLSINIFLSEGYVSAQERNLVQEQIRINKYFNDSLSWTYIKDTTQLIVFTFSAVVETDTTGLVHLVSLTASDTIAYQLYPGYEFLKGVNYKLFMGGRKKAIFIFPMLLQTYSALKREVDTHTVAFPFLRHC